MSRYTAIYIVLLIILCAISFHEGQKNRVVNETIITKVKTDTVYIERPIPIEVKPIGHIIDNFPIINSQELRTHLIDSLQNINLSQEKTNKEISTDSARVTIPISRYLYKDPRYEISISGYGVNLDYAKIFNTSTAKETTTLLSQYRSSKQWCINTGIYGSPNDISLGVSIGYKIDKWYFSGGYQFSPQSHGFMFSIQHSILTF